MFGLGEDKIVNGYRIRYVSHGKAGAWYGVDQSGNVNSGERVDPDTGVPYTGAQKDGNTMSFLAAAAIGVAIVWYVAKNALGNARDSTW